MKLILQEWRELSTLTHITLQTAISSNKILLSSRPQVFQVFELPVETEKLETHQLLLLTKRDLFLHAVFNSSYNPQDNLTLFKEVSSRVEII